MGGESGFPVGCAGSEGGKGPIVRDGGFLGNVFLWQLFLG